MKRQLLEFQADRIEATLARYNIHTRVTGGTVAPRWIQFQLLPALGTRLNQIKVLAEELALALGVETCRISRRKGALAVEIPRPDPQPVRLLSLQRRLVESADEAPPFCSALLGLAEDGAPLLVRLPSPRVAHLLIAGTTGSGKSALMRTIIVSLALGHTPRELGFVLIDPKRRAFGPLGELPHLVRPVLSEPENIIGALRALVQLMLERDRNEQSTPRIVVVIDELADLLMTAGEDCQRALTRLAQRGREAGIHLVACTQKPTSALVGSLAKANFPVRIVGRVISPEEAKVATGYAGTGAECLRGPGDFVAVIGGQVTRFQGAYLEDADLAEVVERIRADNREETLIELPEPRKPAREVAIDKIAEYAAQVRDLWPSLLESDGSLRWGAKADLAEAIHGKRTTAGHYGRIVDQVIARLRKKKAPENTTTTTETRLIPAFLRKKGSCRVVVVVSEGYRWKVLPGGMPL